MQRTQDTLFDQQRATQTALLKAFLPGLPQSEIEPLAEITQAGFAAIALWWCVTQSIRETWPAAPC